MAKVPLPWERGVAGVCSGSSPHRFPRTHPASIASTGERFLATSATLDSKSLSPNSCRTIFEQSKTLQMGARECGPIAGPLQTNMLGLRCQLETAQ